MSGPRRSEEARRGACGTTLRLLHETALGRVWSCGDCGRWRVEFGAVVLTREIGWFLRLGECVAARLARVEGRGPDGASSAVGVAEGTVLMVADHELRELQLLLSGATHRVLGAAEAVAEA